MDVIQQRGRLIAGVSADTLLFGYCNPLTGQLEGFDIDLVRQVAQAIFGDPEPRRVQGGHVRAAHPRAARRLRRHRRRRDDGQLRAVGADLLLVAVLRRRARRSSCGTDSPVTDISQLNGKRMCAARGSTNIDNLKNYPKVIVGAGRRHLRLHGAVPAGDASTPSPATTPCSPGSSRRTRTPRSSARRSPASPTASAWRRRIPEFVRFVNSVLEDVRADGTWAAHVPQVAAADAARCPRRRSPSTDGTP